VVSPTLSGRHRPLVSALGMLVRWSSTSPNKGASLTRRKDTERSIAIVTMDLAFMQVMAVS
jgi:hypothetical protein